MKKTITLLVAAMATLLLVNTAFAKCPQPRKTPAAPANIAGKDDTAKADKANGKKLYEKYKQEFPKKENTIT